MTEAVATKAIFRIGVPISSISIAVQDTRSLRRRVNNQLEQITRCPAIPPTIGRQICFGGSFGWPGNGGRETGCLPNCPADVAVVSAIMAQASIIQPAIKGTRQVCRSSIISFIAIKVDVIRYHSEADINVRAGFPARWYLRDHPGCVAFTGASYNVSE